MTVPTWMAPLVSAVELASADDLTRFPAPPDAELRSAVLMLFGEQQGEPDLLIIERAHDMRSHAGQPAFPGGRVDADDADAVATALREAEEETGLDPRGVEIVAVLPELFIPPSGFVVSPVLGWWARPTPVFAKDPAEVASVHRIAVAELADPANRVRVRHRSGYVGPAFEVRGLLVWGFTGGLVDRLIHLGGWEQPWSPGSRLVPLPDDLDRPITGPDHHQRRDRT